jgi:hypothetical protein
MYTAVEFVTSNKSKPLLFYDGYILKNKKSTEKVTNWVGQHGTCNATVHTGSNDQYLTSGGNHEAHLPSPAQIELKNFRDIAKKQLLSGLSMKRSWLVQIYLRRVWQLLRLQTKPVSF